VLFSPWIALTMSGARMEAKTVMDATLTLNGLRRRVSDYAGAADPSTGALSLLFADLYEIAPLLIQAGSHEVLLHDATRLAATAAAADVAVQLDMTPGCSHVFRFCAGTSRRRRGRTHQRRRLSASPLRTGALMCVASAACRCERARDLGRTCGSGARGDRQRCEVVERSAGALAVQACSAGSTWDRRGQRRD
jgi:alpha/beta hydrolase fold